MPFYRRDAVSPSAVRVHPGAGIPRSEARDPRERIGVALAGISAEVAELPWDWPRGECTVHSGRPVKVTHYDSPHGVVTYVRH